MWHFQVKIKNTPAQNSVACRDCPDGSPLFKTPEEFLFTLALCFLAVAELEQCGPVCFRVEPCSLPSFMALYRAFRVSHFTRPQAFSFLHWKWSDAWTPNHSTAVLMPSIYPQPLSFILMALALHRVNYMALTLALMWMFEQLSMVHDFAIWPLLFCGWECVLF